MSNSRFWLICLVYVCLNFDYTHMIILTHWGRDKWPPFSIKISLKFVPKGQINNIHWNKSVVILTRFSSLAALEVVILTTSGAAGDEHFVEVGTLPFQCSSIGLDNGLAPTRRQAIIWTKDGKFTDEYMRHSASMS